jgi:biopolymer transport protein ExbD
MRRENANTGLEGAPDIMLLTMAALMVAIVWLVSHAHEATLPPIELPSSPEARLGSAETQPIHVTLRAREGDQLEIFLEDRRVAGGLAGLESELRGFGAREITLRADARARWQDVLDVMTLGSRLGLRIAVAAGADAGA